MTTTRRFRRFLAGMAVVTVAAGVAVAVGTGSASASPASDGMETQLLAMLNSARQGAGLAPLAADGAIAQVARSWSGHMVAVHARTGDPVVNPAAPTDCEQSSLCHNPSLGTAVGDLVPGWTRIGENIGVGGDAATVNQALLNSPGHYANIMGDYNRVGVGVVMDGSRLWATFDFANAPGAPTATAPTAAAVVATPVPTVGTNGRYHPVTPQRIADTRSSHGPVTAATTLAVAVPAAVPADATGVVVNLTAAGAATAGYLTAYPCGAAPPTASNLNISAGETRANQAAVALDTTKTMCVYSSTTTDVIIDLAGYYAPTGDRYQAQTPTRLFDSRSAGGPATAFTVPVAGGSAVTVNLTVTNPATAGYLTAYPCGMTAPVVSNVNFTTGQTIANLATVAVAANHTICLFSSTPTDIIIDHAGTFAATGATYTSAVTTRLLDTRTTLGGHPGPATPTDTIEIQIAGSRAIPPNATSATINLTATATTTPGYVAAYPCDQPRPTVSNLNYDAATTAANLATVRLSTTGTLCLTTNTTTHLIADIAGWYTS
jgi:hypothetical protein